MDFICELLFPNRCIVCNQIIHFREKKFFCNSCSDILKRIHGKRCIRCSKLIKFGDLCNDCTSKKIFFDKNFSLFAYDGLIQNIINKFKFQDHPYIGKVLGEVMASHINLFEDMRFDFIVPIPIHMFRRRKRGFNQSEIISSAISKALSLPIKSKSLIRVKNTKPQWRLNPDERANNLIGAFKANKSLVEGKNIFLIDDIFTTGTTINKCAEVLKTSGASSVCSYTFAITTTNSDMT
jgi:ComF family protein